MAQKRPRTGPFFVLGLSIVVNIQVELLTDFEKPFFGMKFLY